MTNKPVKVGVRELKARLSFYVERAAAGDVIVVTERGRPVAQLTPLTGDPLVRRLIAEGLADWPQPGPET